MKTITFEVKGMHCPSCEMLIDDVLGDEKEVAKSSSSWKSGSVVVEGDVALDAKKLAKLIEDQGYEVVNIK